MRNKCCPLYLGLYSVCFLRRSQTKNVTQTSKGPKAEIKWWKHLTTLLNPIPTLWWVWPSPASIYWQIVYFSFLSCKCRIFPFSGGIWDAWNSCGRSWRHQTSSEHTRLDVQQFGWALQSMFWICLVDLFSDSCISAGRGQFLTVCTRLDRQDRCVDDWLWKECGLAITHHLGPPYSLGRRQPRRWLPLGSGQPHWYTGQHAATDLNTTLNMCGNLLSVLPPLLLSEQLQMHWLLKLVVLNCGNELYWKNTAWGCKKKWRMWLITITTHF